MVYLYGWGDTELILDQDKGILLHGLGWGGTCAHCALIVPLVMQTDYNYYDMLIIKEYDLSISIL